MNWLDESDQDSAQQESQPGDEAAEVVSGGGEYDIDSVAGGMGGIIAAQAVSVLAMADHRLDGLALPAFTLPKLPGIGRRSPQES